MTEDDFGQPDVPARALPQSVRRGATDRTLWEAVLGRGRVTRAELATSTGISKPTVSESVRRLVAAGLLDETGRQQTGRRGRVGTFYGVGAAAGWILALAVDQSGVHARSVDLTGRPLTEHEHPPGPAGDTRVLVETMRTAARRAVAATGTGHGPLRAVGVSVANPVDLKSHAVIALPHSPFREGLLSPDEVLADLVGGPVLVDNDVNLATLAEHRAGAAVGVGSFAYVYVGAGLGLGLFLGDRLVRGAHGLAGEIGYLPADHDGTGPPTLVGKLAADGFGRSDAPSNDVAALVRLLDRADDRNDREAQQALVALSAAIAQAVASVTVVVDPELVLLGGPVGTHPALLEPVRDTLIPIAPRPVRLEHGSLGALAPLHGATHLALEHARAAALSQETGAALA